MTSKDIITEKLMNGAYRRKEFQGFEDDYAVLHCLLRKYNPSSVFEVGTNTGLGVNVISRAVPFSDLYSLDLDYDSMMKNPGEFPIGSNGEDRTGSEAEVVFNQLRGDSMKFDYSSTPCKAYFVDGCHDYEHPYHETKEILKLSPKLIIWHDADMPEVWRAILDAMLLSDLDINDYSLTKVEDCRIAFAIKLD